MRNKEYATVNARIRLHEPGGGPTPTGLVVGHDRSEGSGHVLTVAVDMAARLGGARLHVVHGVDLDDYPIDPDAADWEEQAARVLEQQRDAVERIVGSAPGGWSYHASRGDPADLLVAVAEEIDALVIVVGTRGGGAAAAFDRLLDRSVSRAVIRRQYRPVLVVPPLATTWQAPPAGR